ncbi:hypothetical protein WJX73_007298 [Symbiochloris irregularis]|uniref:Universal stress protein n=1 Tax=Symbiochloris irregularis TaxID=706552 RepID=A0AAW1NR45_9CHLO
MSPIFVAVNNIHSKASRKLVEQASALHDRTGGTLHLAHVLLDVVVLPCQKARVLAVFEQTFRHLLVKHPGITVRFHVIDVERALSSYSQPAALKAEALARRAAELECTVMLVGGSSCKTRDTPPAAFLLGHSMEHWLRTVSPIPIIFAADMQMTSHLKMDKSVHRAFVSCQ